MNDHITNRPGAKRYLLSLLAVGLVALGLPVLIAGSASAHTPSMNASCRGVTVTGTSYESANVNTLGIRIDGGAWTTKAFSVNDSLTVAVPQDGDTHTYNAYVHTNNANPAYSHDYSGTVGPCGDKHVTAALWDKTDPTCVADGALVPKTQPTGITAHKSPSGTGPGHYTITFTASAGYAIDGPTSQTIDVLPKLTGDQCATVVEPVSPNVTNPACTGPGTGNPGTITLPADGGGISYSKSGATVTAVADANHKFGSVPSGWTLVDAHHATYAVTFNPPDGYPECLVETLTPVPPVPSSPSCDTDGDLVVSPVDHVVTKVDGVVITETTHVGPGTHQLHYIAAAGYSFAKDATTTFSIEVGAMTLDCPVTPVSPTVTQSACTGPGTSSDPVVVLGDIVGDHLTYTYDASTHVVTAMPEAGFALANLPAGWVMGQGSATFQVTLDDPGPCLVETAVPTPPVPTTPTCDTDGSLHVEPADHVVTRVDGDVIGDPADFGPGEHTIGYAPAAGYAFDPEADTSFVVTVSPRTNDCPAGVVSPIVTQSTCTADGTQTDPAVTLSDLEGDHVSYLYDATAQTVTATPDDGFALGELPDGWSSQEDGTATYAVVLTDPGPCVIVSPPTVPDSPTSTPTPPSVLPNTGGPGVRLAAAALGLLLAGVTMARIGRRRTGLRVS